MLSLRIERIERECPKCDMNERDETSFITCFDANC